MIFFRRHFLSFAESWFEMPQSAAGVDVVRVLQISSPPAAYPTEKFETLFLDLRQDEAVLLAQIDKNTRYEIRRAAEKDDLRYQAWSRPDAETVAAFSTFFDSFSRSKGLLPLNRDRLAKYAEGGVLDLSCTQRPDGGVLTWHAYFRHPTRARLLHSASHFRDSDDTATRGLIGRANRYHHWRDIQRLKAEGTEVYDFGGLYSGREDPERLRINQFKEKFGGARVLNYNVEFGVTWKGKVFLRLRQPAGETYRRILRLRQALTAARAET